MLCFEPAPPRLVSGAATYALSLEGGAARTLFFSAECFGDDRPKPESFMKGFMSANRHQKAMTRTVATVETSNEIFNEVMCRSTSDLYMLLTETPQGPYPYAGIPWYSTTFGRDGIITAIQMLWCDPGDRQGRAGAARRLPGYERGPAGRCRAGQDPARDARRRDGRAARGAVRALLRLGRLDAAVRGPGRHVPRTHRRSRGHSGTLAGNRARARLDGRARRSRRRRLPRICTRRQERTAEPGMEGFATTPSTTPTERWPKGRSRSSKCRATPMRPASSPPHAPASSATPFAPRNSKRRPSGLAERFEQAFWCEEIDTYAIALDGQKRPAACAPRMRARCCGPASPVRTARAASPTISSRPTSSRDGGSERSPRAKRATIPCPIMTDRSGRTTTR